MTWYCNGHQALTKAPQNRVATTLVIPQETGRDLRRCARNALPARFRNGRYTLLGLALARGVVQSV